MNYSFIVGCIAFIIGLITCGFIIWKVWKGLDILSAWVEQKAEGSEKQ